MTDSQLRPEFLVHSEAALRSLFPKVHDLAVRKCLDRLDPHARDFIARAPFLCIGTQAPDGAADVSPRGDPPGFVRVLDDATLLVPDRPGNNRLDTLSNIIANPVIGLLFMIPGFDETLRVNGRAAITRDPDLLRLMTINDRAPTLAIAVTISEVFLHCAKAFRRSKLWDPAQHQDRSGMPSLTRIILDQTSAPPKDPAEMEILDAGLERAYRENLY